MMAKSRTLDSHLILLILLSWQKDIVEAIVEARSLDFSLPLVKTSPGQESSDRFGYSVSLHHIVKPEKGNFESFLSNAR